LFNGDIKKASEYLKSIGICGAAREDDWHNNFLSYFIWDQVVLDKMKVVKRVK